MENGESKLHPRSLAHELPLRSSHWKPKLLSAGAGHARSSCPEGFGMSNIEYSISSGEVRKLCTWTLGVQHSILDISETGVNRQSDWLNCEWLGGLYLFSCS